MKIVLNNTVVRRVISNDGSCNRCIFKNNNAENFTVTVREVRLSAGAGFIVPLTGSVMTMPGLPKNPLACRM